MQNRAAWGGTAEFGGWEQHCRIFVKLKLLLLPWMKDNWNGLF